MIQKTFDFLQVFFFQKIMFFVMKHKLFSCKRYPPTPYNVEICTCAMQKTLFPPSNFALLQHCMGSGGRGSSEHK